MSDFTVRPYQPDDFDAAKRLWRTRFGAPEEKVQKWLDAACNERYRTSADVAVSGSDDDAGDVIGIGVLEIGSADYTRSYVGLEETGLDAPVDGLSGLMHMYCVDETWEGRGVGTALFRTHLQRLREKDVARAYGISWHRPHRDGADSRAVFEKLGFDCLGTYERFYQRTSPRSYCPDCGGDCTCTASIYGKTLAGDAPG